MLQNDLRRQNQASTDGLGCLGGRAGPLESPIDISCILTRPDFLGMPYLLVINLVINLLQKIITSVSKIITSGFVWDLGTQEEFDDNFWCFVKVRCSTLYFSTSETCRFGFLGSVRPKSSLARRNCSKTTSEGKTKHLLMVWGVWVVGLVHWSHPSIFLAS